MAIRFDSSYNAEIKRVVRNFNQKRNRAIKRGFTHLPPKLTVQELKSRYSTRSDLNRELNQLRKFNKDRDDALELIETSGGAKAIKWEYDYLKHNIKYAKDFYDREIDEARKLDTNLKVSQAEYINNLMSKRAYLDLELAELNQSQFRTYKKTINEYLYANERNSNSYRGWLEEVEVIMRYLGYDNKTIDKFFEGFDTLTPREFITMYRQSSLVSRIYELYIPTRDASFHLSTSGASARGLIEDFMQQKDELIAKAKK